LITCGFRWKAPRSRAKSNITRKVNPIHNATNLILSMYGAPAVYSK
jgi:hypothetical protein